MSKRSHRTLSSLTGALALGLACMSPAAQATLTITSVVGGVPSGATRVNFDTLPLGGTGGPSGGITVSFASSGQTVLGSVGGQYAAPVLSNSNGVLFGDPTNGADTTPYLTTGDSQVILALPSSREVFWPALGVCGRLQHPAIL